MSEFYDIDVEIDGRRHKGQWTLKQGGKICVGGFYGSRIVDLGGRQTVTVAREILEEFGFSASEVDEFMACGVTAQAT